MEDTTRTTTTTDKPEDEELSAVQFTCMCTAARRLLESRRPDALFVDDWAERLTNAKAVERELKKEEEEKRAGRVHTEASYLTVRCKYFDDYVCQSTKLTDEGSSSQIQIEQVVSLACGMDTRAFRLGLPSNIKFFEVDMSEVMQVKNKKLKDAKPPTCQRVCISTDLAERVWPQTLKEAGFDPNRPTLWTIEGLSYYLEAQDFVHLLQDVASISASGSRILFDIITTEVLEGCKLERSVYKDHFKSGFDDPKSLVESVACVFESAVRRSKLFPLSGLVQRTIPKCSFSGQLY
jgi:methyltransferase (TIGR00027 family)